MPTQRSGRALHRSVPKLSGDDAFDRTGLQPGTSRYARLVRFTTQNPTSNIAMPYLANE